MEEDYYDPLIAEDEDDEPCQVCGGEGYYHDCGEDTCCCANPDEDDQMVCEWCGGSGLSH